MKKISYSKYKIGISYNEESKVFKVQKRCVFLILHKGLDSPLETMN